MKLRAPQVVRGSVQKGDGSPAAGVEVCLQGTNGDVAWLGAMPASWWLLRVYAGERQVRTDANGAFAFGDVAPGEYALSLTRMTQAEEASENVTVVAGTDPKPILLTR